LGLSQKDIRNKLALIAVENNLSFAAVLESAYKETKLVNIDTNYLVWIDQVENNLFNRLPKINVKKRKISDSSLFTIVLVVLTDEHELLRESIDSIVRQAQPNWRLALIAVDTAAIKVLLKDLRIKHYPITSEVTLFQSLNSAIEGRDSDYFIFLNAGDQLSADALDVLGHYCVQNPLSELIVTDEDMLDDAGRRTDPFFKPDWNPDYLSAFNYFSKAVIYSKSLLNSVVGFNPDTNDPFYDLALRATQHLSDAKIQHISRILFHLKQRDLGRVRKVPVVMPQPEPFVSLIIPTRDQLALLKTCIDGLLHKTDYKNFEIIIVDNQSQQVETFDYLKKLSSNPKITLLSYNKPFNYSAMNNFAVEHAKGSVIGLLNNDISILNEEWLSEMVAQACRVEIGCVGAKLYYPDGSIQHAGVILGLKGYASHAHKGFAGDATGYFNRLIVAHNVSAVTAACLVMRKQIFEAVGGFDSVNLKVAYNDIDLCLKVTEAGYRNLFTPYAELIHHESKSRGKKRSWLKQRQLRKESAYFRKKWHKHLFSDPAYNKNLTLLTEDFSLGLGRNET
jgi:GT2 family glycosyltransferase